jgi:alkylation response protein AidB-like acyl-CoA dehydrogenase
MEFDLDEGQVELQRQFRRFCGDRFALADTRPRLDETAVLDRARWRELADQGVFSLAMDGVRPVDAVIVFHELGRALVPGPLLGGVLGGAILDDVASGEVIASVAERAAGRPVTITNLEAAGLVLVVDDDGVWKLDPAAVDATELQTPLDPMTRTWRAATLPSGERLLDAEGAQRWRAFGSLLTSALLAGNAQATLDIAVAYAKDRQQFGRAIGSFQAVKHLLADMLVRSEVANVAVQAAGVLLEEPGHENVGRAIATARITAGRAAIDNGKACIQVHGGMGYTWELDAHLLLKRVLVLDQAPGTVAGAIDAVAASL